VRRKLSAVEWWAVLTSAVVLVAFSGKSCLLLAAGLDAPPPWSDNAGAMPQQASFNPGPAAPFSPTQAARPGSWPGGAPQTATPAPGGVYRWTATPDAPPPLGAAPAGCPTCTGPTCAAPGTAPATPESPTSARPAGNAAAPDQRRIEEMDKVAQIGSDVILARDLMPALALVRAQNKDTVPAVELEKQITEALKKALEGKLETKLIYQHAIRKIPPESFPKVKESVIEEFDKHQIPDLMKRAKVDSRIELDEKLKAAGMSVESQKRDFVETVIAHEWLKQQVKPVDSVDHEEMVDYYQTHGAEFDRAARARWEQLTVVTAKFASRDAAYAQLAQMGNDVLRGMPLAQVARTRSQGATAAAGGLRDWTTQGVLVSKVLDKAIFGLPVGQLSQIIEDDGMLHIVRVIERTDAGRLPFTEAQVKIREKIKKKKNDEEKEKYLAQVKKEIGVWTCFESPADDKPAADKPADETPRAASTGGFFR
jgi:parvulin-like peptidyl-prolyl isomerase